MLMTNFLTRLLEVTRAEKQLSPVSIGVQSMKVVLLILLSIREEMPIAQSLQLVYRLFNLAKISFSALLLASICTQARAQNAAVFKDSTGAIYLYGLPPSSSVEVGTVGNLVKAIPSNECGLLVIRANSTFSIDSQIINPNAITDVRTLTNNCSTYTNYPNVFKTPEGAFTEGGGFRIAMTGKSPNTPYALAFPNHKTTRQVSVNPCGYAVLRNVTATSLNLPTVTGGGGSSLSHPYPKQNLWHV